MKTVDLKEQKPSVDDLLTMAKSESVLIHTVDGDQFILEEADEIEREIATLGSSEKFMAFLEERSKEKGGVPMSEVAQRLGTEDG